jgi:hypothetical protein
MIKKANQNLLNHLMKSKNKINKKTTNNLSQIMSLKVSQKRKKEEKRRKKKKKKKKK